jgi:hypothetical protein
MFRRRESNRQSDRLGLAISAPISAIKNNSEIIYMTSDSTLPNLPSVLPPAPPPPKQQELHPSPHISSSDSSPTLKSQSSTPSTPAYTYNSQSQRTSSSVTPPSPSESSFEVTRPTPAIPAPQAAPRLDDVAMITYIDLGTSASTVQMIGSTGRLPRWLQRCTSLQYLIAQDLGITVIDEWVSSSLTNLKVIRLNNNKISTWPDHLARLLPHGQLQVLSLEGNPCMDNMFKKSAVFKSMYLEAALSGQAAHGETPIETVLARTKSSNSSTGSGSGSRSIHGKQSLFKMTRKVDDGASSDEDDDDMLTAIEPSARAPPMLKKHSSATNLFSSFTRNKSSAATKEDRSPIKKRPSQSSVTERPQSQATVQVSDKVVNQKVERIDVDKTNVVLRLLRDIYEMATRKTIDPLVSDPTVRREPSSLSASRPDSSQIRPASSQTALSSTSSSLSSGSSRITSISTSVSSGGHDTMTHQRLNSLDVLQHYLQEVDIAADPMKTYNPDFLTQQLTDFVEAERQFVEKMKEFASIYLTAKKESKRAEKIFRGMPEMLNLHLNTMLVTCNVGVERVKRGQDPHLEFFNHSMMSVIAPFERVYEEFALVVEESKRQGLMWLRLQNVNAPQPVFYGSTPPPYVPSQHPDVDIAEWLRACIKHKNHSLRSVLDYLDLPLQRLEHYRSFFGEIVSMCPVVEIMYSKLTVLTRDVERRKPLAARQARQSDLQKMFKIPEEYGGYLCDANIIIQGQLTLEESGRGGDVIYLQRNSTGAVVRTYPVSRSVSFSLNDVSRPPKGTVLRMIVYRDAVVFVVESRRVVHKVIRKADIHASAPWDHGDDVEATPVERATSISRASGSAGTTITTTSTSSGHVQNLNDLSNCLRLSIRDSVEMWYVTIRTFTGDRAGSTLRETRQAIIDAVATTA